MIAAETPAAKMGWRKYCFKCMRIPREDSSKLNPFNASAFFRYFRACSHFKPIGRISGILSQSRVNRQPGPLYFFAVELLWKTLSSQYFSWVGAGVNRKKFLKKSRPGLYI
jgi:hypothetical protein